MFRVGDSDARLLLSATTLIAVMLFLALVLGISAVYLVLGEYHLLGRWLACAGPTSHAELAALRRDIGVRFVVRTTASALLLLCTLATLWLGRRQFAFQRALDQVKRLSRLVFGSIDQGVITTDRDYVISSINSSAARLLDVGADAVGRPLAGISSVDVPLLDLADRIIARGEVVRGHDCVVDRDGRIRRIYVDAHVLKDAADRTLGCVILLRNVSERVLMEERVRRMEQLLSLATWASGLCHEIKNPLTALGLHVQLLEERLLSSSTVVPPVQELIGVVKTELRRLNDVLESCRDSADFQRPTDVVDLLKEVVRLIGPQADRQRVEVSMRRPEVDLPRVALAAEKFRQAVLNLILNALESMPQGGHLTLAASARDGEVQVEISDTGPGIAPEVQAERLKPYSSTKDRGTGMGLALTEEWIGQHGGRVDFRTGLRGTTFRIAIPLEPPVESDRPQ